MAEIFNKIIAKKFSYVNLFVYIYIIIKNKQSAVVLFLLTLRILNEKLKGVSQVAELVDGCFPSEQHAFNGYRFESLFWLYYILL